jgi:hypothetical protein
VPIDETIPINRWRPSRVVRQGASLRAEEKIMSERDNGKPAKRAKKKLTINEDRVKNLEVSEAEAEKVAGGSLVQVLFGETSPPGRGPAYIPLSW